MKMNFIETKLAGAYCIEPATVHDSRGGFARIFCKNDFKKIGLDKEFVQFNHSFNTKKGTLRGMHYQKHPYGEIKLIRCIRGAVFDVIVDIRRTSPTFLHWFGMELSSRNMKMMYVPEGFAHGFLTLEDNSELLYHHTNFYESTAERGIHCTDKMVGINWPGAIDCISEKDNGYLPLTKEYLEKEL